MITVNLGYRSYSVYPDPEKQPMQTVIKHFPIKPGARREALGAGSELHGDMTPDEVTAWLDERDCRRRQRHSLGAAFWIIATALVLATIGFFTH